MYIHVREAHSKPLLIVSPPLPPMYAWTVHLLSHNHNQGPLSDVIAAAHHFLPYISLLRSCSACCCDGNQVWRPVTPCVRRRERVSIEKCFHAEQCSTLMCYKMFAIVD